MDPIVRTSIQFIPNDVKKELGNAAYLMNSALNFVNNIERIVNQYEHLDKEISFFSKPLSNLGQALLRNKQLLQQAISQQYLFEQKLNKFLGRTINFAWVDTETGEVLFIDEIAAHRIYMQADTQAQNKNKAYTGKIYADVVQNNKPNNIPEFIKSVEEGYDKLVNDRLRDHQSLLKQVLDRWNENHKNEEENFWAKEHRDTVWWERPPEGVGNFHHPKYEWSAKVNRGHISQEYVNFIFNSIKKIDTTESGIGTFMMLSSGKRDTTPGIVKGDVVIEKNKNVQIAVKSGQFDTASIAPYLRVAFQVIAFYDEIQSLTIEEVEKILKNTKRYNQKVTEVGRKKAQEVIENTAKTTGAQVFST